MSDTSFFNGVDQTAKNSNVTNADPAIVAPAIPEPALIGDGKKYKDIFTADKALADKEAFIKQLQDENASLRTVTTKFSTMEEAFKRLEAKNTQTANGEQPTSATVATSANTQTFDPNKVEEIVEAKVSKLEQSRIQEANRLQVASKLTSYCNGDTQKANQIIENRAQELGVTKEYIQQQARIAPAAVLSLLIPSGTSVPTQGIPPGSATLPSVDTNEYNPLKDPMLAQFGKPTLDGKGYRVKDAKSWERQIASKLGVKV